MRKKVLFTVLLLSICFFRIFAGPLDGMTFSGATLVDNEICTVKINSIKIDNFWGLKLNVEIVNNTSDKELDLSIDNVSVDGVMNTTYFSKSVLPGKTLREDLTISESIYNQIGLNKYTDIEMKVKVLDYNDYWSPPLFEEYCHVYPFGEENACVFTRSPQASDLVLFDNDEVSFAVTEINENGPWDSYSIMCAIANKSSDVPYAFTINDASINNLKSDPYFTTSVGPGKITFKEIAYEKSTFAKYGIKEVTDIQLIMTVSDDSSYWGDSLLDHEVFHIYPKGLNQ